MNLRFYVNKSLTLPKNFMVNPLKSVTITRIN